MTKILIVDDDASILSILTLSLKPHGYEVLTARDGAAAMALLEQQPVDLILADVAMPRLNGYELYEQVKTSARPELVLTPIILLSARTLDSDIRYAKALGADDYLTKPLNLEDVLAVVQGKLLAADRLRRLFNRQAGGPASLTLLVNQALLRLDFRQHRAWLGEVELELSAREMFLLERLARQPNEIVSLAELVQATHDLSTDDQEASQLVRPLIRTLRRKLEAHLGNEPWLKNVRGRGYLLVAERAGVDLDPPSS